MVNGALTVPQSSSIPKLLDATRWICLDCGTWHKYSRWVSFGAADWTFVLWRHEPSSSQITEKSLSMLSFSAGC